MLKACQAEWALQKQMHGRALVLGKRRAMCLDLSVQSGRM